MKTFKTENYPVQLNKRIWLLGHSYFNIYLVRGDKASALIETGVSSTADGIIHQLKSLDVIPDYLTVTHPHGDHITGLPALCEAFPSAKVIAGHGAPEFAATPKISSSMVRDDRYMTKFMTEEGIANIRNPLIVPPSLKNCFIKKEGDLIDLGGVTLRFYPFKGHSPGNISVHIPEMKTLIVSDSLGFYYPDKRFFPVYFTGYTDYMTTIYRLESFKADIIGPGHQGVFIGENVRKAFFMARENAIDLSKRILSDTRCDNAIMQDIFEDYYRDELCLYSPENITGCCRLLVRRSRE